MDMKVEKRRRERIAASLCLLYAGFGLSFGLEMVAVRLTWQVSDCRLEIEAVVIVIATATCASGIRSI